MKFKKAVSAFAALTMAISVFASLGVTANAAETGAATVKMTYVDGSTAKLDTAYGEIGAGSPAYIGYNKIDGGKVELANSGWGVNGITYLQVDASAITGNITKATLTADMAGPTSSRGVTVGVGYNSSSWSADLTYNTADRTITTVGQTVTMSKNSVASDTYVNKSWDITDALSSDDDKIVTILMYSTTAGGATVKNPAVSVEYVAAGTTLYTATFKETSGIEPNITIYSDAERTSTIGNGSLLADKTYYYTATSAGYKDYEGSFTVSSTGTNEVSFTMTAKATYTATVKAVCGEVELGTYASNVFEGDNATVYYPAVIEKDGAVYRVAANTSDQDTVATGNQTTYWGKLFIGVSDNVSENIEYTKIENGVYAAEIENMDKSADASLTEKTDFSGRYAEGKAQALKSGTLYTSALSAGTYTVYVGARNGSKTTETVDIYLADSTDTLNTKATATLSWGSGATNEQTKNNIVVPEGGKIALNNSTNTALALDYIYVVKQDVPTIITVSINSVGSTGATEVANLTEGYEVTAADTKADTATTFKTDGMTTTTVYIKVDNAVDNVMPTVTFGGVDYTPKYTYKANGGSYYVYQFIDTKGKDAVTKVTYPNAVDYTITAE